MIRSSIIRWHEVPRWRFGAVLTLWIVSLAIYAWDYAVGMALLFSLSLAHVYLEFPLNAQSFVGIGREVRTLARSLPALVRDGARLAAHHPSGRRRA